MTGYRADMSRNELWQWHSEVYAYRRVTLGISADERTSPPDPEGKWFNEGMILQAEQRLRAKRTSAADARRQRAAADDLAEARRIEDEWCRARGYRDIEHYEGAEDIDHSEACKRIVASIASSTELRNHAAFGEKQEITERSEALRQMGVMAREGTAAELRAGRIALGLERMEAAE